MTNYEKYKPEIIELLTSYDGLSVVNGKPKNCCLTKCENCELRVPPYCKAKRKEWLESEAEL